jgi:hypothetical protein
MEGIKLKRTTGPPPRFHWACFFFFDKKPAILSGQVFSAHLIKDLTKKHALDPASHQETFLNNQNTKRLKKYNLLKQMYYNHKHELKFY